MNEGMDHETGAALASALAVARLRAVRIGLLHLHKTLLDAERERYVRERGPIDGPGHALKLVLNDPFFAWLRPSRRSSCRSTSGSPTTRRSGRPKPVP
jgi:hypothetical protein